MVASESRTDRFLRPRGLFCQLEWLSRHGSLLCPDAYDSRAAQGKRPPLEANLHVKTASPSLPFHISFDLHAATHCHMMPHFHGNLSPYACATTLGECLLVPSDLHHPRMGAILSCSSFLRRASSFSAAGSFSASSTPLAPSLAPPLPLSVSLHTRSPTFARRAAASQRSALNATIVISRKLGKSPSQMWRVPITVSLLARGMPCARHCL